MEGSIRVFQIRSQPFNSPLLPVTDNSLKFGKRMDADPKVLVGSSARDVHLIKCFGVRESFAIRFEEMCVFFVRAIPFEPLLPTYAFHRRSGVLESASARAMHDWVRLNLFWSQGTKGFSQFHLPGVQFGPIPIWLWVKPMVPFWGRCTTHLRTYFSGDWDVHWVRDFDPWPFVTQALLSSLLVFKGIP